MANFVCSLAINGTCVVRQQIPRPKKTSDWQLMGLTNLAKKSLQKGLATFGYQLHKFGPNDGYLDKKEFRYVLWIDRVYSKIRTVPGHIVELGVARGRNSLIFANLIDMYGEGHLRKYYGFDTFQGYTEEDMKVDRHLKGDAWKNDAEWVQKRIDNAGFSGTSKLVVGDIKKTVPDFLENNPNFRAALLYVDCNAYLPASLALEAFKKHMSPGGIICIDELRQGGETRALIEFCQKHSLKYVKDDSPFSIPAYTVID